MTPDTDTLLHTPLHGEHAAQLFDLGTTSLAPFHVSTKLVAAFAVDDRQQFTPVAGTAA